MVVVRWVALSRKPLRGRGEGLHRALARERPVVAAPLGLQAQDCGVPQPFVPQKIKAMQRAKRIVAAGGAAVAVAAAYVLLRLA